MEVDFLFSTRRWKVGVEQTVIPRGEMKAKKEKKKKKKKRRESEGEGK